MTEEEGSQSVDGAVQVVARLEELAQRLTAMDARFEILDIEGRYSRTWDTGDAAGWARLFTDTGAFEITGVGGDPDQRFEGRAALEQMCQNFTRTVTGLHLLHLPEIITNGDNATSRIHFEFRSVRRDAADLTQQANVAGYYETIYERTDEGWRIANRREKVVKRERVVFYDL